MNTKLYKKVHTQAVELLKAADGGNDELFQQLYEELKSLCIDNEAVERMDHPVQWETLADFTEDSDQAKSYYLKALACAQAIQANDYLASIYYALAQIECESESNDTAVEFALLANRHAAKIPDKELKQEIRALLKSLE
jgi:hypothetical protein